ncbi:Ig-like domain-containing protein [Massilia sp. R2A-15]|uniref:Ig-like domain-containing protein n=1 Tax=Massilia sp. R2A-15 TaxID=3064278 RepID=UPI00273505CB|nr:Ig-like domain-containing protein [Massilia sp. R2A-15]WLI89493.1 Ig-like domain-containing protein [Massilia sp. R2A-15]
MFAYLNNLSWHKVRALAAGSLAATVLAACGGGGGSPGTVPGQTGGGSSTGTAPASITLIASAATISASGADGTEVTLTAIVKDANNNALPGATVSFKADSGTISNTNRVSDATGSVTEKLSVKGDPSPRDITITASAGSITSAARVVKVVSAAATAPKLVLTAASGSLPSSGAAGTAVEIRALVLDSNNVVMPGTTVSFATDSGSLSASQKKTDTSGVAIVSLDTGADPTTRTITVTGTAAGAAATTVTVNVVGTKLAINAPGTANVGAVSDVTVLLVDSAGTPLSNRMVTFSAALNTVVSKSGATSQAATDGAGKLTLTYTAAKAGSDTITVRALGETATAAVMVVASNFTVSAVDANGAALSTASTNVCVPVAVTNFVAGVPQGGTVSVSSSRGTVYSDAACASPLNTAVPLTSGSARVYLSANSPGVATLTANSSATGSSVQRALEFVAPLTATSVISLQATPAVIGANAAGSSTEQSTLRAVVLDSANQGNPVKNAKVVFSIVSDASGGTLTQPSEVMTGSDGSATVSYTAGTTATAADGVLIRATIQSPVTAASATATLTVAKKSLFISAGTGNTVITPTSSTYQVDYVVFVTDAAGNAVPNVTITASVSPRTYGKGIMVLSGPSGPWVPQPSTPAPCNNEDVNRDGVLAASEDANHNGRLDPVIPMNITSSGKTDASGTATVSLLYPRDRAYWMDVDFIIRGQVAGSEGSYLGYTVLRGSAADFGNPNTAPPGAVSPYGRSSTCGDAN